MTKRNRHSSSREIYYTRYTNQYTYLSTHPCPPPWPRFRSCRALQHLCGWWLRGTPRSPCCTGCGPVCYAASTTDTTCSCTTHSSSAIRFYTCEICSFLNRSLQSTHFSCSLIYVYLTFPLLFKCLVWNTSAVIVSSWGVPGCPGRCASAPWPWCNTDSSTSSLNYTAPSCTALS